MSFHVIDVSITSKQGNTALTFPHSGYFGVTPVLLAGTVHLKLEEQYNRQLPIRDVQLQVRCYEILESGGFLASAKEHILWQAGHTLWKPSDGVEEVPFPEGVWTHPFKVRIPVGVVDHASSCKSFREWRVKWRLEVIVNHKPIPYVGHRVARSWPIELYNHCTKLPPPPPPTPPSDALYGSGWAATNIFINPPVGCYGPLDTIPLSVTVRPEDQATLVRKVSVILERRLELLDKGRSRRSSPMPSDDGPPHKTSRISSILAKGISPLTKGEDSHARAITTVVAETSLDVSSATGSGAAWCVGSLTLPGRSHRWDMGETEQTDLVKVTFSMRVKANVKNRRSPSSKDVVSNPVPVVVLASTASERSSATKAADFRQSFGASSSAVFSNESFATTTDEIKTAEELRHKNRCHPNGSLYMLDPSSTNISEIAQVSKSKRTKQPRPILVTEHRSESTSALISPTGVQFAAAPSVSKRHRSGKSSSPEGSSRSASRSGNRQASSAVTSPTSPFGPTPPVSAPYPTSFTSPSAAHSGPLPPLRSMLRYQSPTPAPSMGEDSPRSAAVLSPSTSSLVEDMSYGGLGTAPPGHSDHCQPVVSQSKTWIPVDNHQHLTFGLPLHRPSRDTHRLPSLDALGLGLPQVPDYRPRSRPSTAPHPSGYPGRDVSAPRLDGRPQSSGSTSSFAF